MGAKMQDIEMRIKKRKNHTRTLRDFYVLAKQGVKMSEQPN